VRRRWLPVCQPLPRQHVQYTTRRMVTPLPLPGYLRSETCGSQRTNTAYIDTGLQSMPNQLRSNSPRSVTSYTAPPIIISTKTAQSRTVIHRDHSRDNNYSVSLNQHRHRHSQFVSSFAGFLVSLLPVRGLRHSQPNRHDDNKDILTWHSLEHRKYSATQRE